MGCGINFYTKEVFFTKNGRSLGGPNDHNNPDNPNNPNNLNNLNNPNNPWYQFLYKSVVLHTKTDAR